MIKIEKTEVLGWEHAIRGMRNPMNSWDKSDSYWWSVVDDLPRIYFVGDNDLSLMKKLSKAGTDHRKFMRMIVVYADITAPLYWWKEYDTYKVGTVANSCSTMHKIHVKEFTPDDFSHEHLFRAEDCDCLSTLTDVNGKPTVCQISPNGLLATTIDCLNNYRKRYLETGDKQWWWQMIQLLPTSYNQKRTVMLNYEVLANIYKSRKNHKLDCWVAFCEWVLSLPCAKELIAGVDENS